MLLGGRTAEEIALGEISTGAQNDLQRATDIARAMVTEFGMSDALGAVNYDGHAAAVPRHAVHAGARQSPEETAQKIDAEVKRILTDAHDEARRVLRERRDNLDELSERLLEKEVIEGDELRAMLGPLPPKDPEGTVPPAIPDPGVVVFDPAGNGSFYKGTTWTAASRTSSRKRFNVDPFIRISSRVGALAEDHVRDALRASRTRSGRRPGDPP